MASGTPATRAACSASESVQTPSASVKWNSTLPVASSTETSIVLRARPGKLGAAGDESSASISCKWVAKMADMRLSCSQARRDTPRADPSRAEVPNHDELSANS